jgi:hypothetical protein
LAEREYLERRFLSSVGFAIRGGFSNVLALWYALLDSPNWDGGFDEPSVAALGISLTVMTRPLESGEPLFGIVCTDDCSGADLYGFEPSRLDLLVGFGSSQLIDVAELAYGVRAFHCLVSRDVRTGKATNRSGIVKVSVRIRLIP